MQTFSIQQDLLLVGGGHSHALVLQMWAMDPLPGVRLTLVSDRTHTPYSGMLPGHVAGFYDYDDCHIDLRRLCQAAGAQFFLDRVTGLDPEAQTVSCEGRPCLGFDWLSLDIGSTPAAVAVPGAQDYAIAAKPVPEFLAAWEDILGELRSQIALSSESQLDLNLRPAIRSLGIVGGGAGGVELAVSMAARLRQWAGVEGMATSASMPTIHLFQRGEQLLPGHPGSVGRQFLNILSEQGVQVHLKAAVTAVTKGAAFQETDDGSLGGALTVHHAQGMTCCDRLFWVTNASAPDWIAQSGLSTDGAGFVRVGETLQSVSHPRILAAGDIATMQRHPRPKAGVFAVRQGRPLFENLRSLLQNRAPHPFVPQQQLLALIGTGDGRAVASRGRWSLGPSRLLWWWKDWIDRRFMDRFSQLPVMAMGAEPLGLGEAGEDSPLLYCAGCGAKVGQTSLERVLRRVQADFPAAASQNPATPGAATPGPATLGAATPGPATPEIVMGLDAPDDAAVLRLPGDRLLLQTLDYFQTLVPDPFVFGQITANHCLNDLFAMGAQPHSALALAQVPRGSDRAVEESLYLLLSGAMKILSQSGTALIGGHSTEGDQLAFGLSCNGLATEQQLWTKGGMQPGDVLILTKPLGTGTLFAAQMRGAAKGRWIDGAIATMLQPHHPVMPLLRQHQATACTDITGFGLLGHLGEMVAASGHSVQLQLDALPWLDGAKLTLAQGILSSLHPQNARARRWVENPQALNHPLSAILFDPQTSGGLLAAVPADQADACGAALQTAGFGQCGAIAQVLDSLTPQGPPRILLAGSLGNA